MSEKKEAACSCHRIFKNFVTDLDAKKSARYNKVLATELVVRGIQYGTEITKPLISGWK